MRYIRQFIDPEVRASFRTAEVGFTSRNPDGPVTAPPYIIASVAQHRVVPGAHIELPDGYDNEVLSTIQGTTGWVNEYVRVSPQKAHELAQIGSQILALNEQGQIQPPLGYFEQQSVIHLVSLVGQTAIG